MVLFLLLLVVVIILAGPADATPVGDAHRAINAQYQPQSDGFSVVTYVSCKRVSRRVVDCIMRLAKPLAACQPGTGLLPVGSFIPICEAAGADVIEQITLRVYRGRVRRV